MPQARNMAVWKLQNREKNGSKALVQECKDKMEATHRKAEILNLTESRKFKAVESMLQRSIKQRRAAGIQVASNLRRRTRELKTYGSLLSSNFRSEGMLVLRRENTRRTLRRLMQEGGQDVRKKVVEENRIIREGFSIQRMRNSISDMIKAEDAGAVKDDVRERLLADCRRRSLRLLPRDQSMTTLLRERRQEVLNMAQEATKKQDKLQFYASGVDTYTTGKTIPTPVKGLEPWLAVRARREFGGTKPFYQAPNNGYDDLSEDETGNHGDRASDAESEISLVSIVSLKISRRGLKPPPVVARKEHISSASSIASSIHQQSGVLVTEMPRG